MTAAAQTEVKRALAWAAILCFLAVAIAQELAPSTPLRLPGHRAFPGAVVGAALLPGARRRALWAGVVVGALFGLARASLGSGHHTPQLWRLLGHLVFGALGGALGHLLGRGRSQ